jgi:hypothetical protein
LGFRENAELDIKTVKTALIEVAKLTSTFLSHLHTENRNISLWQTLEKLVEENKSLQPDGSSSSSADHQMTRVHPSTHSPPQLIHQQALVAEVQRSNPIGPSVYTSSSLQYVPPSSLFMPSPMVLSNASTNTNELSSLDMQFLEASSWFSDDISTPY